MPCWYKYIGMCDIYKNFISSKMEHMSYSTFQAFEPHFNGLARVGYYKLVNKPTSNTKQTLHDCYRIFIWFFVLSNNLQHVIKVIQTRHSTDEMVNTLFILLTTLNTLGKQVAFNARSTRIKRIIEVINGSHFAPKNAEHVSILKDNARSMEKLLYFFQTLVISACICLGAYPIVDRAMGHDVHIIAYFPFDTNESPVFEIVAWYLSFNVAFQACGNVTMDCTIAAFYSMARTQLRLLRYNLEHLLEDNAKGEEVTSSRKKSTLFKDSELIQKRLEMCVKHHRQILWFVMEVESIFCEAMAVQFMVMAWVICMTMYKIVSLETVVSGEFCTMFMYLGCMLSQLFIYCYYGTQVRVESHFVPQSVYHSGWTSLSPSFRRKLLVLMQCSSRQIMPCAAKIVPISLDTYISVLRAAYTLFTILEKK